MKRGVALHLNKFEFPLPNDALCQVWLKLPQWFLRRFLNFVNVFLLFCNYLPLERGVAYHMNNLNLLHPRILCAKFCWKWPNGKIFFLILSMYFRYFVIFSPWKRAWPFIWINLDPLHLRMLCDKFDLKLAQWFWRRRWKCEKFTDRQTDRQTMAVSHYP